MVKKYKTFDQAYFSVMAFLLVYRYTKGISPFRDTILVKEHMVKLSADTCCVLLTVNYNIAM